MKTKRKAQRTRRANGAQEYQRAAMRRTMTRLGLNPSDKDDRDFYRALRGMRSIDDVVGVGEGEL